MELQTAITPIRFVLEVRLDTKVRHLGRRVRAACGPGCRFEQVKEIQEISSAMQGQPVDLCLVHGAEANLEAVIQAIQIPSPNTLIIVLGSEDDDRPAMLSAGADDLLCVDGLSTPLLKHAIQRAQEFRAYSAGALPEIEHGDGYAGTVLPEVSEPGTAASHTAERAPEIWQCAIFETALDAIVTVDEKGQILKYNPAAEQIFGYRREEMVGQSVMDKLMPETMHEDYRRAVARYCEHGEWIIENQRVQVKARHADGYEFPVELSIAPVDMDGQTMFVAYLRDISERKAAKAALNGQVRFMEDMLNAMPFNIFMKDEAGTYLFINKAVAKLMGKDAAEVIGYNDDILFPPETVDDVQALDKEAFATGGTLTYEETIPVQGRPTTFWTGKKVLPRRGSEDKVLVGYAIDVTQQKQEEQRLRESEAMLKTLLNNNLQAIVLMGLDYQVKAINRVGKINSKAISGREIEVDYSILDFVKREDWDDFKMIFEQACQGEIVTLEEKLVVGGTLELWFEIQFSPVMDDEGEIMGVCMSGLNIDERKQAEAILRASEERYRLLAENTSDLIARYNMDGRYSYVSPSSRTLFGFELEEMVGKLAYDFIHAEDISEVEAIHRTILEGAAPAVICYRHLKKDGTYLWVETSGQVTVETDTDKALEIVAVTRDITERRASEAALFWESQEKATFSARLKELHRLSTSVYESVEALLEDYMQTGCQLFGMQMGIVNRITDQECVFRGVYPAESSFEQGHRMKLSETFCSLVVARGKTVAIENTDRIVETHHLPSYQSGLVKSYIGTPVEVGGHLYGVLFFVSDRQTRALNTRDLEIVELMAQSIGRVLELEQVAEGKQKIEQDLLSRDAILEAAGFAAEQFLEAPLWQEVVPAVVERLGEATDMSRVYVYENYIGEEGELRARQLVEYEAEGTEPRIGGQHDDFEYGVSGSSRWLENMSQRRAVYGQMHDFTDREKTFLNNQRTKSVALVPIFANEKWYGFIGFDECKEERAWSEPEIEALKVVASTLGAAIERTLAEAALRHSEDRFRSIFNGAGVGISISHMKGDQHFVKINAAMQRMLGYDNVEAAKHSLLELAHPEDSEAFGDFLGRLARPNCGIGQIESRYVSKEGRVVWVRTNASVLSDAEGEAQFVVAIMEDVTARNEAEKEQRQSEAKYESLVSNLAEGILLIDASLNVLASNAAAEKILRTTSDALADNTADSEWEVFWEDRTPALVEDYPAMRTLATGEALVGVVIGLRNRDGEEIWLNCNAQPIVLDEDTGAHAALCSFHDITTLKKAEQEIRKSLEKERELGELKSRFVSMASHEFRTPLATIHASSELLMRYHDRWDQEKQDKLFARIMTCVHKMTNMLEDILIVGKADADKWSYRPEEIEVVTLCDEIIGEVCTVYPTSHEIRMTTESDIIDGWVDEALIRHILTNLVSNAVKYSPEESRITIGVLDIGRACVISVQDQGIGMSEDDQARLFDSFHRGANVGQIQGTGLGMAIVKRALDLCGGEIELESTLGEGSLITVTIPTAKPVEA